MRPFFLCVCLTFALACGDASDESSEPAAVVFVPSGAPADEAALAALRATRVVGRWVGRAEELTFHAASTDDDAGALRISGDPAAGVRRIELRPRGDVAATRFVVEADGEPGATLRVVLRAAGELLHVAETRRFFSGRSVLEFGVPPDARPDEVWVVWGGDEPLLFHELRAERVPPAAHAPLVEAWVRADGTSRRARGIFPGAPAQFDFVSPGAGRARVWLGVPEPVVADGSHRCRASLLAEGAEVWSGALDVGARWAPLEVDLGAHGAGALTLRLQLDASSASALAFSAPRYLAPRPDSESSPPTVVLITSDTHRADYLGAARRGIDVATPALDALAARGVLFEDCVATTNITNPSHVALFTGVHPRDTGVVDNGSPLSDAAPTLAESFQTAGYTTLAAVSAGHLDPVRSGLGQGFEAYAAPRSGEADAFDAVGALLAELPAHADEPLFLWLHVFDAHIPYAPPPEVLARYWPEDRDPRDRALPAPAVAPGWAKGVRDLAYLEALYRGEVTSLDKRLAPLLDVPRVRAGLTALTADHGEYLGVEDGIFDHLRLSTHNLRVPLIVAGPDVPAGARIAGPVENLDLGRTLLDLAGLAAVEFPGRNVLAARDPAVPRFALGRHGDAASIQVGDWFCVLHLIDQSDRGPGLAFAKHQVELFDLAIDPSCTIDLSTRERARAGALRARIVDWLSSARAGGWNVTGVERQALEEAELASLGYGLISKPDSENRWIDPACACEACRAWR